MEYEKQEYKPHDYQKFATDFILQHPISAVILFLGAGKTVITLTAIEELLYDRFEVSKVLIVAPLRVAKVTWKDEITKWDHLQNLSFAVAVGSEKERMDALKQNADITIINRENLQWLIEKSKIPFEYDMVVLDELSSFKSWQSKRFRAFMKVRPKVKRVVGLTGTPAPNSLMDLFAEFKCLDMGQRLGRFITQYRTGYFMPDKMNGQIVYSYKLLPGAEDRIYSKISDITISMKAMDHLKMPELLSERYPVYMDEDESTKYESMKHDLILPYQDEDDITAANAAALSGKLCQMANGAVYSDNGEVVHIHDRKLDALEDLIEAAQGPLLLCYWYKHDLTRIIKRLDQLKVSYDRISSEDSIRKWNEGKYQVGLIHPASAGHGLNLQQGGNVIVWFGLTWSLELYEQTNARLWRQGQQAGAVVVQHIVTAGTIDERILEAISHKEKGQNALIEAVKAEL
jgi:SNF2 family DNA or RNA helicase